MECSPPATGTWLPTGLRDGPGGTAEDRAGEDGAGEDPAGEDWVGRAAVGEGWTEDD
ncbi:hypothetical protein GCM10010524_31270 [Streptomyces mexicanus]